MLLNQEQVRDNEFKHFQSRANYFRLYNQQSHRQEYLKEYSWVRGLLTKHNPVYQNKRKSDRHKLDRKNRYQLEVLISELSKRGWTENSKITNKKSLSTLPFFFFNVVVVDKKSALTSYICKSFFFYPPAQGQTHQQKQDAYLFAYLVQKEGKELRELLSKKPQLFSKRLKEIEKTSQVVNGHWKKSDIIQTINQIPQEKNWQLPTYWEKQDLSALLLKYQEAGGKNKLVLDFDHYKKDENGDYLVNEEQRKKIDLVIDYLINYWKLPWYEVSKSGGRKLHLNIDELPLKSKLWWKLLVIGDILGKGSQTTLPLSKNRKIEFSKWSEGGLKLPEIKLENWKQDLAKFSLGDYDKGTVLMRSFKEAGRQQSNFLSTTTTLKKELGYYGTKVVRPLKIFTPQYVKKLSSVGGSQDSHYYQVPYLDPVSQQVERFLVDSGWREKEFQKIVDWDCSKFRLVLRRGERVDFLLGVG